ncbi:MAG: XTP/dITP diphosphatase [Clostridia bacterium]|nr:XTP/dITP diphosphatase [Clostridia bacterium]
MDIVFASNNQGKVREVRAMLEGSDIRIHSLADLELHIDVVEDGHSFIENALIKASTIAGLLKRPVLADDSGLEVDALGGAPGVYSARYGGPGLKDEERLQLLLDEMKDVPDAKRTARFVCVMALVDPDGTNLTARGTVEGSIIHEAQGNGGFGYDPAFLPRGYQDTFGILPAETKNRISHRSMALLKMKKLLEARG